jgi:tRNA A-37 threonylcarbamoyl transferase component Bud32
MSWWERFKVWLREGDPPAFEAPPFEALPLPPPPAFDDPAVNLLLDLADPAEPVKPPELAEALASLSQAGQEARAMELLGQALRQRPDQEDLLSSLAFLRVGRLEHDLARPLLERLLQSSTYGLRAELALAEGAEAQGDDACALRHYERVLARDVTHDAALRAVRRLRVRLGARTELAPLATMVQPEGVATRGRYELVHELGRGASATVYLARDRKLARRVALKLYHPQVMRADGPAQLVREASLPGRVGHPAIVKVLDVDQELGAVTMELVDGPSLRDRLRRVGAEPAMTSLEALLVIEGVCQPLGALHQEGIVHRDIKPGNILLRAGELGRPVLTDLGVALLPGEGHQPGVGTPAFMAPEQRTETSLDARADVYALGVLLAALLGGYPGPEGPVGDLLERCLNEAPAGRPRDAVELAELVAGLRWRLENDAMYRDDVQRVTELSSMTEDR